MAQEIICLLDKSGSMDSVKEDAKGGFNTFLKDQKKLGEANLTVIWFDHSFKVEYEGLLSKMKPIKEWPVEGMTALHDAIGKTFEHVSPRFSKESPEKVILAILTDGAENSSRSFSKEDVAELIKHHQEKYGWTVIFLAADQDAWATAEGLNIQQGNAFSYSSANTVDGLALYSSAVTRSRSV